VVSDFYDQKSTLKALAAICGPGKLSHDLEKLLISAHHHIEAIKARLDVVKNEISDCRDAWAPDHPPPDLASFLDDLEAILK